MYVKLILALGQLSTHQNAPVQSISPSTISILSRTQLDAPETSFGKPLCLHQTCFSIEQPGLLLSPWPEKKIQIRYKFSSIIVKSEVNFIDNSYNVVLSFRILLSNNQNAFLPFVFQSFDWSFPWQIRHTLKEELLVFQAQTFSAINIEEIIIFFIFDPVIILFKIHTSAPISFAFFFDISFWQANNFSLDSGSNDSRYLSTAALYSIISCLYFSFNCSFSLGFKFVHIVAAFLNFSVCFKPVILSVDLTTKFIKALMGFLGGGGNPKCSLAVFMDIWRVKLLPHLQKFEIIF